MYKILIADDEDIVRDGIKTLINWNELGLDLIADVADGLEAYNVIKNKKPDIALIDINMPKLDGINLIKKLRDENIKSEIVIITGYDEFSYAREALRLNVKDYILKPLTKYEMIELLKNIVSKMDEKNIKQEEIKRGKKKLKDNVRVLRREFINNIIFGGINDNNIKEKSEFLDMDINSTFYAIALVDIDNLDIDKLGDKHGDIRTIKNKIYSITSELLIENKNGYFFYTNENEMAILYTSNEKIKGKAHKEFMNIIQKIKEYSKSNLNIEVSIGSGLLVKNIFKISSSYFQANKALQHRFFIGVNKVIDFESIENFKYSKNSDFRNIEELLFTKVKDLKNEEVKKQLNIISNFMKDKLVNIDICRNECIKITIRILGIFMDMNVDIYKALGIHLNVTKEISVLRNLQDIEEWIYNIYQKIEIYVQESSSNNKIYMFNIIKYIKQNYSNCDLNLKLLCEEVHLSMSYLSVIFKKETGNTFVEYLTKLRMEKAKELLKNTNNKTYRIAEMVGYSDTHYFSSSFKKYYKITPTEYRKQEKRGN